MSKWGAPRITPSPKLDPPNTNIPASDATQAFIAEARKWIGVKEHGSNKGPEVEMFQRSVDGSAESESWCMCFMQYCVKEAEKSLGIKSLIYRSEHCLTTWKNSPTSIKSAKPSPGAIIIWQHGSSSSGHTGVVVSVGTDGTLTSVEGNTGPEDHVNGNGDGCYLKHRSPNGSGDMKIVGYLKPFA